MRDKYFAVVFATIALILFVAAAGAQSVTQLGQLTTVADYAGFFGDAEAISPDGRTVAVVAPAAGYGYISIYEEPSTGWTTVSPTAFLSEENLQQCLGTGIAISADGSTIAATGTQCYGGLGFGSAWILIFERPASGWQSINTPTAVIVDKTDTGLSSCGNNFSFSPDGNTLACVDGFGWGAHESRLFFFDRPATGWASTTTPNLSVNLGKIAYRPAIDGNIIALNVTPLGREIEVMQRTSTGLKQLATLKASDGASFGPVSLDSSSIVAGQAVETTPPYVYVFSEPASGWTNATETARLSVSGLASNSEFGTSVAISGSSILVGGTFTDAAYLFVEPASGWQTTSQPDATIVTTDPYSFNFGFSVAIQGQTIAIGDPYEDELDVQNGAAWVFQEN